MFIFLDMKIDPKDFNLQLYVQHWSGCWGGTVPKTLIQEPMDFLRGLNSDWLHIFLAKADPDRMKVEAVDKSRNGKTVEFAGEYIIEVSLENVLDYRCDIERTPVVVTCADGVPVHSQMRYNQQLIVNGLFSGYQLGHGRDRYTLRLPYRRVSGDMYDHLVFKRPYGTIVASHLFLLEGGLKGKGLSSSTPDHTSVIVHCPKSYKRQ